MENDVPDEIDAILFANSIVHGFIYEEYQAKMHLDDVFGGAYEIAVWESGSFKKVDNRNYYFGNMVFDKEKSSNTARLFSKLDYCGDLLRIRTEDWRSGERKGRFHLVRPITRSMSDYCDDRLEEILTEPMEYTASWQMTSVLARFKSVSPPMQYLICEYRPDCDHVIAYGRRPAKELAIETRPEFQALVREALHKYVALCIMGKQPVVHRILTVGNIENAC